MIIDHINVYRVITVSHPQRRVWNLCQARVIIYVQTCNEINYNCSPLAIRRFARMKQKRFTRLATCTLWTCTYALHVIAARKPTIMTCASLTARDTCVSCVRTCSAVCAHERKSSSETRVENILWSQYNARCTQSRIPALVCMRLEIFIKFIMCDPFENNVWCEPWYAVYTCL